MKTKRFKEYAERRLGIDSVKDIKIEALEDDIKIRDLTIKKAKGLLESCIKKPGDVFDISKIHVLVENIICSISLLEGEEVEMNKINPTPIEKFISNHPYSQRDAIEYIVNNDLNELCEAVIKLEEDLKNNED